MDSTAIFGIIVGSGLGEFFTPIEKSTAQTLYGSVDFCQITVGGRRGILLNRHGVRGNIPPHRINYHANIYCLKQIGVKYVIAVNAAGSLNSEMKPRDLVVIDSFIDFTKNRSYTFFDGEDGRVVYTDMTYPYDRRIRSALIRAGRGLGMKIHDHGVYVCVEGPRYETSAEIEMFKKMNGDLVGMTGIPEVILADEVGLRYAALVVVTNWAAGYQRKVSHKEVVRVMSEASQSVKRLLESTIRLLS